MRALTMEDIAGAFDALFPMPFELRPTPTVHIHPGLVLPAILRRRRRTEVMQRGTRKQRNKMQRADAKQRRGRTRDAAGRPL